MKDSVQNDVAMRLYFFFQPGCDACAEAEPHLSSFLHRNPAVMTVRLNINGNWTIHGWSPKSTPGYLLVADTEKLGHRFGVQTDKELVGWFRESGLPVR